MENENRTNQSWKHKLEDEVALQREGLTDKAVAWQKLQHRLQQPARRRAIWYWSAAACLVLMIAVPFVIQQNNTNNLVKNAIPEKTKTVLQKQSVHANNVITVTKRVDARPSAKKKTIKTETNNSNVAAVINNDSGMGISNKEENINAISLPLPVVDTSETITATVQLKQQLKVVHVNELGDPVIESSILTRSTEPHVFEMQIGKQEIITNVNSNINKSRFAAISFKTSPTN